jgi:8-oxo-dGTP pyrophosphatase MutT (NUDIX family)/predicted GNAT family N-acyltransferase
MEKLPEDRDPFQDLGSRPVYDNAWISVAEHQVVRPDGQPGIYGVVHFKNRAVGVVPYEEDGTVWLVGQHRFPLKRYSWEIPEGGAPEGESLEDCARRELREETGLEAGRLEPLLTLHLSNSVTDETATLFLARDLRRGPAAPEGSEVLRVARVPLSEALQRVESGEITDAMTVAALLRLARYGVPSAREWERDGFVVSTDPRRLDLDAAHRFIHGSYWAKGIPRDVFEKSLRHSLAFGIYETATGKQVGLARVITDYATFAYLGDVFIDDAARGRGLGKWLMECILQHPELQSLRRFSLATKDAHSLYAQYGFKPTADPQNWMEIKDSEIYLRHSK